MRADIGQGVLGRRVNFPRLRPRSEMGVEKTSANNCVLRSTNAARFDDGQLHSEIPDGTHNAILLPRRYFMQFRGGRSAEHEPIREQDVLDKRGSKFREKLVEDRRLRTK